MAGAGTGPAAMPMGGGFGFAGNYGAPAMPPSFNFAGGPMNIGRSGQVKPSGQYSGGFMGQGPAIQPIQGGRDFLPTPPIAQPIVAPGVDPRLDSQPIADAIFDRTGGPMNIGNTGQVGPGGPLFSPRPVLGGRRGYIEPGRPDLRMGLPTPPMMTSISRPQPTPISEGGPQVPAGASPGGNFFTDDQGRQMYQPPMPEAPPGMMIPQVMPAPIEVGPQASATPPFMVSANAPGGDPTASLPGDKLGALEALNQTPPFDPAGGPVSQPMKQAPIRYEQEDFGPSDESVFERSARGVRAAMGATGTEMGFQPSRVQGFGYDVGDVTGTIGPYAGDISGRGYRAPSIAANIGAFVNPFEQQVVEGALGDIERQRQMQANQLAAQFQAARGFGGSRQAIQEAELARSAMEQGAGTAATLRQQGFGQALQAAGQQANLGARAAEFGLGQRMQAQLANQAARQRFGEFAGGQSMQAQLANQAAQARAREFGLGQGMQAQLANQQAKLAGSQQRLGAASQLANLANLGFGMGQTVQRQMAQQGALQQQLQQQIMNAARQQFEGFRNYPAQALGYYAQALGATPTPQSQQTTKQLGLMDYLTAAAGIGGMLMQSDRRLKSNITKIGKLPSGQNVYSWTWNDKAGEIGLSGDSIGVMADETDPSMVSVGSDGYQMVNYGALLA